LPGELPIWWSDGKAVEFLTSVALQVPDEQLITFVEDRAAALRVVTTNDGLDVLLLKQRAPSGGARTEWLGAALGITDLLSAADLRELVQAGLDVELIGDDGSPVYWTTPFGLDDPVASVIRL